MADNATESSGARVNSASDLAAQNAEMDAEIEREAKEHHERKRRVIAQQAEKPKAPNDPLRPLEVAGSFVKGTVMGTLGGVGQGARYGFFTGAFVGILGCIAMGTGALPMALFAGLVGCSLGGALLGGATGMLTGGVTGVHKEMQREAIVDQQAIAKKGRSKPTVSQGPSQADIREENRTRSRLNFDRSRQQDLENQRDTATYWQDRVAAESHGWGMGRE